MKLAQGECSIPLMDFPSELHIYSNYAEFLSHFISSTGEKCQLFSFGKETNCSLCVILCINSSKCWQTAGIAAVQCWSNCLKWVELLEVIKLVECSDFLGTWYQEKTIVSVSVRSFRKVEVMTRVVKWWLLSYMWIVSNSSTACMPYLQHIIGWLTVLEQRLLGNSYLSWGRKWAGIAGPLGTLVQGARVSCRAIVTCKWLPKIPLLDETKIIVQDSIMLGMEKCLCPFCPFLP